MLYKSLLFLLFYFLVTNLSSQSLTLDGYDKESNEVYSEFEKILSDLYISYDKHIAEYPNIPFNIEHKAELLLDNYLKKMGDLAVRYVSLPEGAERLFASRLSIPKNKIIEALKEIPDSLQHSPYVSSLRFHIETLQIEIGDPAYDFTATTSEGDPFKLSSLSNKAIILVYGGMDCMGPDGRNHLKQMHESLNKEKAIILIFENVASDLKSLVNNKNLFADEYVWVSDFLGDHSPVKIIYGTQTTPTFFIIDKSGYLVHRGWIGNAEIEKYLL